MDGNKTCELLFDSFNMKFVWILVIICMIIIGKIRDFLIWIKDNLLRERPELFIQDDSV